MAHLMKRRRLINPRRRRLTPGQIPFFGTKRQRAAFKARKRRRRHNAGPMSMRKTVKRLKKKGATASQIWGLRKGYGGIYKRRRNVGEILTVMPANPGRRRRSSMYRTHNRRRNRRRRHMATAEYNRRYNRGRRHHNRRRRHHNPTVRYHNRRRAYGLFNRRHRRRNPGVLTGNVGAIVGILGGAAVTKIITGFLPSGITTGFAGYLATGVAAVVAGQLAGRMTRNRQFGNWVMIGGLLIVGLELVGQFFPTLQLPFGLTSGGTAGLGLISSSNFYVPQVNMPGSMASFVTPAGVTAAIPVVPTSAGMHGLGAQFTPGLRTMRRIGRMR